MKTFLYKIIFKLKKILKLLSTKTGRKRLIELIKIRLGLNKTKISYKLTKKERDKEESTVFSHDIKFSIVVPLYNTPLKFLKDMINSVKAQTYKNWELCLTDCSDLKHAYVGKCVREFMKNDNRIRYKKIEKHLGISDNTNIGLEMANGEYICLLDHDDILHPSALFENAKAICEQDADFLYSDEVVFLGTNISNVIGFHFKPDFSLDYLRSNNYICHLTVFKKELLKQVGLLRSNFDGAQDHDLFLRLTEKAQNIVHIPKVLYFWRSHKNSVAHGISAKPYAPLAGINAVKEHLKRCNLEAEVESSEICPTAYRIKYKIKGNPLISIIIPNKDHIKDLNRCIKSIIEKSTYDNFEIIIVENNSKKIKTFDYYDSLKIYRKKIETFDYHSSLKNYSNIKIVEWQGKFNYPAINNFGVQFAGGEHIIFLNNDTKVISDNWIEEMLMYSQREDVGAVGAKLYYPDNIIQHGGVTLGIKGVTGHSHKGFDGNIPNYMEGLFIVQNYSVVTGACMMVPKHVFEEVGGFDEAFDVTFNVADLCIRIRQAGYNIVWNFIR